MRKRATQSSKYVYSLSMCTNSTNLYESNIYIYVYSIIYIYYIATCQDLYNSNWVLCSFFTPITSVLFRTTHAFRTLEHPPICSRQKKNKGRIKQKHLCPRDSKRLEQLKMRKIWFVYLRFVCWLVGTNKQNNYSPNGGLMVTYHGRK